MKTKFALISGVIIAILMVAYSFVQMDNDHSVKRDYYSKRESARSLGYQLDEPAVKPYELTSRAAGRVTGLLTLALLTVNFLLVRALKAKKAFYISSIILVAGSAICAFFSVVLMKSTGGVTFDETGVIWVLLGIVSVIFYSIVLIKLKQIIASTKLKYQ